MTKHTSIAKELFIVRSTYTYYENDKSRPNIDMLIKFVQLYGVTTDFLLGVEPKREDIENEFYAHFTTLEFKKQMIIIDNLRQMII